MKQKTAVLLVSAPFIWWIFIFVNQLNTDLSCTSTDAFCNSANTVWGDFTWSLAAWFMSIAFITPFAAIAFAIWHLLKKRKKSK